MMQKSLVYGLLISSVALSLSACAKTREQFDFSKKAPDEFAVIKRAPLEMPPDFNLPAPSPGAKRPQEPSATDLARGAILGDDSIKKTATDNNISEGEAVLLQRTGASNVPSNIRAAVDKETDEIADDESEGIDTLKKWVGQNVAPKGKVVDPVAEAARIKASKAAGAPITTGKTPTVTK